MPSGNTAGVLTNDGFGQYFPGQQAAAPLPGTGDATQVAFWNGSSSITGTNSLWFDSGNSRLGVGNESPQFDIDVQNITGATIDAPAYFGSGGLNDLSNGGVYSCTSGPHV